MLIYGCLIMGFWLYLVGGLQARFGEWGTISGVRKFNHNLFSRFCHVNSFSISYLGRAQQWRRHKSHHRMLLLLRLLFRHHDGSRLLDIPCRDLPHARPLQGCLTLYRHELAV